RGIYNAIHRGVEPELFPCLHKFGIAFYEFNPIAGGFFTGRYNSVDDKPESGSCFDPGRSQLKEPYFQAAVRVERHGPTMAEVAPRWISHHSLVRRECGDAVLIGASSLEHIEQILLLLSLLGHVHSD
ncbi:aflatoxin B1 aldehyde reductase 3, isoform CRA_a, partial [Mycena galericulata]